MKKPKKARPRPKRLIKIIYKNIGKYGIKQVPLAGAGLGFAISRLLMKGDFAGAGAELVVCLFQVVV